MSEPEELTTNYLFDLKPYQPCADYPWECFSLCIPMEEVFERAKSENIRNSVLSSGRHWKWICNSCEKYITVGHVCLGDGAPWRFWVKCGCIFSGSEIGVNDQAKFLKDVCPPDGIHRFIRQITMNYVNALMKRAKAGVEGSYTEVDNESGETHIDKVPGISRKFVKILMKHEIFTVAELSAAEDEYLESFQGIGARSVRQFREAIEKYNA